MDVKTPDSYKFLIKVFCNKKLLNCPIAEDFCPTNLCPSLVQKKEKKKTNYKNLVYVCNPKA